MAKTHVLHPAAALMAKLRGVNELDNRDHGICSVHIGGGKYENAIQNGPVSSAVLPVRFFGYFRAIRGRLSVEIHVNRAQRLGMARP